MRGIFTRFFDLEALSQWQVTAADVTFYFRWPSDAAWNMTWQRLKWWVTQADRINGIRAGDDDE